MQLVILVFPKEQLQTQLSDIFVFSDDLNGVLAALQVQFKVCGTERILWLQRVLSVNHRNRRVEDKLTSDNSTILPGSISIAIGLFMPSERCANGGSVRIVGVGGSTRLAEGESTNNSLGGNLSVVKQL